MPFVAVSTSCFCDITRVYIVIPAQHFILLTDSQFNIPKFRTNVVMFGLYGTTNKLFNEIRCLFLCLLLSHIFITF